MKKFLKTHLKCVGVKEDESWTKEYLAPIQSFVDSYNNRDDIVIGDVGLGADDTLIFLVDFYAPTKKECDARFVLFKSELTRLLKPYHLTKIEPMLKAYGDRI